MTLLNTIADTSCTDHLPRPVGASDQDHSQVELALPSPSMPKISDSGRISFGAAMRLPTAR